MQARIDNVTYVLAALWRKHRGYSDSLNSLYKYHRKFARQYSAIKSQSARLKRILVLIDKIEEPRVRSDILFIHYRAELKSIAEYESKVDEAVNKLAEIAGLM